LGRIGWAVFALALQVPLFAVVQAKPKSENVHTPNTDCARCHTMDRAMIEGNVATASTHVVPDVEAQCNACHGDEGPSHRTGMPPRQPIPETLPLSSSGMITCSTCHFVHGEPNPFGAFVRIDNSRGALCLTCHRLEDLQ
jgi:predicted CXXCH cytochrome family protein